ncbi:MAG: CAP domain-containing protein [Gaiellaceae bacterium]
MLIKRKILVAFLALFALLGSAAAAGARGLSSPEASLLQTMNAVRTSRGLPPLRLDVRLLRAARGHSADMMHRQYFAHGSVTGRVLAQGARGPVFGEDLAWGTGVTAQWVVGRWLASPTHRAVLLRAGFRRVGIGITFGSFAGHGGAAVVTADFAGR